MWVLNLIKSHKPVFFADFCAFTLCCRIIYKLSCFSHWFEAHTQDNPILANGKGKGVARIPAGTAKCFYLFLCTYTSLSSAWAPDTTGEDMFPLLKVCDLKSCFPINPVAEEQKARERERVEVTPNWLQACGWWDWLSLTAVITSQRFSLRKARDKCNDNWYFIDVK